MILVILHCTKEKKKTLNFHITRSASTNILNNFEIKGYIFKIKVQQIRERRKRNPPNVFEFGAETIMLPSSTALMMNFGKDEVCGKWLDWLLLAAIFSSAARAFVFLIFFKRFYDFI